MLTDFNNQEKSFVVNQDLSSDESDTDDEVFISKANFMSGASGEGADGRRGSKERVCESARVRGRNQGQKRRPKLGQRIPHGSSVRAKT